MALFVLTNPDTFGNMMKKEDKSMEIEVRQKGRKKTFKVKVGYKLDKNIATKLAEVSEKTGINKSRLVEKALSELFEKIEKEGAIRI